MAVKPATSRPRFAGSRSVRPATSATNGASTRSRMPTQPSTRQTGASGVWASKRCPTYTCNSVHKLAMTTIAVIIPRRRLTVCCLVSVSMTMLTPIGLEMLQQGSVPHALADREAPAAGDPLPEAVSDGELPHIAAHGAGRPDPQRQAHGAAQTGRLVRVPGPAIVEEGRLPEPHEAPQVVRDEHPVLEREPYHVCAGERMDAEDARAVLRDPQVELAAGLGAAELRSFDVENQGLPREILARDGECTRHPPRVRSPRGEDAVRRRSQHRE